MSVCDVVKARTVIDRLSIIWKFDLSDEKTGFLQNNGGVNTGVGMHHMDANKTHVEKAGWDLYKNATSYI